MGMKFRYALKKLLSVSAAALMICTATAAALPLAAETGDLSVSAAGTPVINTTKVTLYAMDDWAEPYISIPSSYTTRYQLRVTGANSVTYQSSNGKVKVSASGLIEPNYATYYWYNFGNGMSYGFSSPDPDRTPVKVTKYAEYGSSVITVRADGQTFTVNVELKDYVDTYVNKTIDDYLKSNITSSMSTHDKVVKIAKFIAARDYSAEYCSAEGLVVAGGGDCWASSETAVLMAKKLGFRAWIRNGNKDAYAGSGHKNAVITDGKEIYILEAGYSGKAPRAYDVTKRSTLFSTRSVSGGLEVYQYDGETVPAKLTVPAYIDGKPVVNIAREFITNNNTLKEVVLPETLKYIGVNAFYGCTALEKINIPASVTTIDERAFAGCKSIKSVTTGTGYRYTGGALYKGTTLVSCPNGTNVSVASGTKEIFAGAFSFNDLLTSVELPSTVEKIGEGAFSQCRNLKNLNISSAKIKTIPSYAFAYNSAAYCTIPDTVTEISPHAFEPLTKGKEMLLVGKAGGAAETYAKANGHAFLDSAKAVKNTSKVSSTTVVVGDTIKVTASYTGGKAPYKLEVYKKHQYDSAYSANLISGTSSAVSFKAEKTGSYTVKTVVTDGYGIRQEKTMSVSVRGVLTNTSTLSADSITLGQSVTVSVKAAGGSGGYTYALDQKTSSGTWQRVVPLGSTSSMTFKPTASGTCELRTVVRDSGGRMAYSYLSLKAEPKNLTNLSAVSTGKTLVKRAVTVTGKADGGTGVYRYALDYKLSGQTTWTSVRELSKVSAMSFTPQTAGEYTLRVTIKDSANRVSYKSFSLSVRNALNSKLRFSSSSVAHGQTVTITMSATAGFGGYQYKLTCLAPNSSTWRTVSAYSAANKVSFTPETYGKFRFRYTVRDSAGFTFTREYELDVKEKPLTNSSKLSSASVTLGSYAYVYCGASGSNSPFRYTMQVKAPGSSTYRTLYTDTSSTRLSFKPDKSGTWYIRLTVKDSKGAVSAKTLTLTVK
ncbi:MAG: leucine-rich repeat protein [Clostridia bacterium]|nr:leucine-rich repeat protein [Clostridia bacterium]